jgi:hypothetical protein
MPTPGTASHQEYNAAMIAQLRAELQPGLRPIKEFRLAAPAASVIFANIPGNYRDLELAMRIRSTRAAPQETDDVALIFNADAGPRYAWGFIQRNAAGFASAENLAQNQIQLGQCEAGGSTANFFSPVTLRIVGYNESRPIHYALAYSTKVGNLSAVADYALNFRSGAWTPVGATPVTSVTIFCMAGNIDTGSFVTLRGVL